MANNPYVNKVQLADGTSLIDISSDTVTADKLMQGYTAHDRTGALITGTAAPNLQSKNYTVNSAGTATVTADSGYDGLSSVEVSVPSASLLVDSSSYYETVSGVRKWYYTPVATAGIMGGYDPGWAEGVYNGRRVTFNAVPAGVTITPSTSPQTIGGNEYMMEGPVTVAAISSDAFIVTLSWDSTEELWMPDKTITALQDAYENDEEIIFVCDDGRPVGWFYDDDYVFVYVVFSGGNNELIQTYYIFTTQGVEEGTVDRTIVPVFESPSVTYTPTESQQTQTITYNPNDGYNGIEEVSVTVNAISSTYVGTGITRRSSTDLTASGATVTVPSGYYSEQASKAVASGTAGTPTATKGNVSNHSVSVTPSVTNTTGYITGSTKAGTAVSVSASELVSGTLSITSSGTKDVTNYASASVGAGTEGTPTATKGTVSNHSVSVTPSVTNTGGYITGGTKTGTAVTVTASELASGNKAITENGTNIDVVGYSTVSVDVQGGGGYTWETLSDQNVTIVADTPPYPNYCYWTFTDPLSADETYRITWGSGGTQYICETVADPQSFTYDGYYLGNLRVFGSQYPDTGEPFALYRNSATRMIASTNQATGTLHIKVEKQVSTSATLIEKTITANGTYDAEDDDADGYSSVTVNVPSGSSKNVQVLQSTSRTNSSSLTKVLGDLTVSKTGTYDIYWSGGRSNTSSSYTWGTRLYVDGTGYGTENTTWTNNCQSNHLSNVSLTANQKLSVYARGRTGSYYTFAPMLVIIEV